MEHVISFLFKYKASLFSRSEFSFGVRPSVVLIVLLLAATGALVYFIYFAPSLRLAGRWRAALVSLRLLLLVLIFFCLMRPVVVVPSVVPQSSYVAVLMDDSASMKLTDEGGRARLDAVKQLLDESSEFYNALSSKFKLRPFKFSAGAERVQGAAELTGDGDQTNLGAAIEQAVRDSAGLQLAGVIVITDGATNTEAVAGPDVATTLSNLRARGLPVFTVGVGQTRLEGDVEIVRATAPRRALAGSPVTAELLIRSSGGEPKSVKVDLIEDSHPLRSQPVPVQGDATGVARITFTPSAPGLHHYTVIATPAADEPVTDNNSQQFLIKVEDSRPRILYIEGEPRWEYGKMRAALAEEKNVSLVSVLRSADGKFYRQGVSGAEELAAGFPKSEEELFKYDAIIVGSVEATFFTFDQLRAIEQFVSRRGGALLVLGGSKSFTSGGYASTPMADLLPVYLNGEMTPAGESQNFKPAPSERGRDHPAARLEDQPEANLRAWAEMPAITLLEVPNTIKPGASVILEARGTRDKNRVAPLLVEERYGRGRTLALMASDTWRWRMMLEFKNKSFETFWTHLLRNLVELVRRPVEATVERSLYAKGEQAIIRIEAVDEKYIAVNDATVTARVISPSGQAVEVAMKPTTEGGFEGYAGTFVPAEDGLYRIEAGARRADSKQGAHLGDSDACFVVGPLNREARNAEQNRELLKRIAAETGGAYYTSAQASGLVDDLTHSGGAGSVRETKELWDMPINFLLAVSLAAAEWFIRKRKGLA